MPAPNSVGPPLDVDAVVSTTMEGILYGFSLLMFGMTVWVLTRRKKLGEYNVAMLVVAFLLLILSTMHMVVDIVRIFRGFVTLRDTGKTLDFFGDISQMTFIFKNSVYTFQTVLGDSVVIYRAYVVWQSFWPIVLPITILGGVIATAIGSVLNASLATPGSPLPVFERAGSWITAFFSSTLACNFIGTLTLAFRLWVLERKMRKVRSNRRSLIPIVLICVDSGLLYSVFLLSALILLVRGSRAQFIVLDMISPIISISFYAIILRVELEKANREQPPGGSSGYSIPSVRPTGISRNRSRGGYSSHAHSIRSDPNTYPPPAVLVNITKETRMDGKPHSSHSDDYQDGY